MGPWLKQSTAVNIRLGPFFDSVDGVTAETGLTISQGDVRLSKNHGAFGQKNSATACSHDENGWYSCPLDATDTGTTGPLIVSVQESGALPVVLRFMVVDDSTYKMLVDNDDATIASLYTILSTYVSETLALTLSGNATPGDIPTPADVAAALASGFELNVHAAATAYTLTIFRGDTYLEAQGTEIPIVKAANETHWPDTISTVHLTAQPTADTLENDPDAASLTDIACASVDNDSFNIQLTEAQTASLTAGPAAYDFWLVANQSTYPKTLRSGRMTVRAAPSA